MPVFLNGQTAPKNAKPSKSLTKYYPLLTGRPTSTIGWFSSNHKTVFDKIDSMGKTIEALILANNGDSPEFNVSGSVIDTTEAQRIVELSNHDQFLLAKDVQGSYTTYDVYLLGFEKMSTSVNHKQTNLLIPIIYATGPNDSFVLSTETMDPQGWTSYTDDIISDVLKNITLQELYDHAMTYYFNTDMRDLLTSMPSMAKQQSKKSSLSLDDKYIIQSYAIIKHFQAAKPFNPIQLGAFVRELTRNSSDVPLLNQLLLQFPELTFASLSEQFELAAPTFPSL